MQVYLSKSILKVMSPNPVVRSHEPTVRNAPPVGEHDTAALAVSLSTTASLLHRRLRAVSAESELTPSQRSALGRLVEAGPSTIAQLARAELVRPQSMRATLGVLAERGLVAREAHPTDGRQLQVHPTPAGRQALAALQQAKHGWLAERLGTLGGPELRRVAEAAEVLRELVEE